MDDRAVMQMLAEAILANRRDAIDGHFAAHGARIEPLAWSPDSSVTDNGVLHFLIDYWNSLRGDKPLPAADAVSPFDLKPALGHIVLIDVLDDGWDGRFRVYGTKVAETYGRDMTGRLVSEIDGGNYVSQFFRALYRVAWQRQEAYFSRHFPPPHVAVESWQRLALPLAGPDGTVSRFLACNIAGAWRPPRPRPGQQHTPRSA